VNNPHNIQLKDLEMLAIIGVSLKSAHCGGSPRPGAHARTAGQLASIGSAASTAAKLAEPERGPDARPVGRLASIRLGQDASSPRSARPGAPRRPPVLAEPPGASCWRSAERRELLAVAERVSPRFSSAHGNGETMMSKP